MRVYAAIVVGSLLACSAQADTWTLNGDQSKIAFGSVKNHEVGEVHSFGALSGTVDASGATEVEIGLASVETLIDIRNERMIEHVFNKVATASLSAQVDMATLNDLAVGDGTTIELDGSLSLLGQDVPFFTDMYVARMGEQRVLVTTNELLFLDTYELGINDGISKLQEIAGLDDITRAVPITVRLVFDQDGQGS